MQRLQGEGVRGADLVFACVGPALEIYSRYSHVETAEGREVELPEYLEKVWEVVGREALQQVLGTAEAQARNGTAGALEEDARLTALFLWTMQSTTESALPPIATAKRTARPEKTRRKKTKRPAGRSPATACRSTWPAASLSLLASTSMIGRGRVINTQKGVVRLLLVRERDRQLFGESGVAARADEIESSAASSPQLSLFPEAPPTVRAPYDGGAGRRTSASSGTRRR